MSLQTIARVLPPVAGLIGSAEGRVELINSTLVEEVHELVRQRVEELFIKLQLIATGWLYLGTTKPGLVYRLKGNPPQPHE